MIKKTRTMIKKREIIASIIFIAIYLIGGLQVSEYLHNIEVDINSKYSKAIKIDSKDLFEYGMNTNVGNAFVYGNLSAVDTVTYPEVAGEYMYIERVTEEYTLHTRNVSHTSTSNGVSTVYYTTETYYTWDEVDTDSKTCNKINFCGFEFDSDKISFPGTRYISEYDVSYDTRYKFYGVDTEYTGTIFTYLGDNTISNKSLFIQGRNAQETYECLTSYSMIPIFWIVWIALGIIGVYGFYRLENKWLD